MLTAIAIDETDLREARKVLHFFFEHVNSANCSFCHVTDELEVEARDEVIEKLRSDDLAQGDPVHRVVLIFGPIKFVSENLVDRLNSEERHWV